jgi:hypothetical protein
MSVDLLPHIIEIKEGMARMETRVQTIETAVVGRDGESGLQKRVSSLEDDRTKVRTIAASAGLFGGAMSWLISHLPRL